MIIWLASYPKSGNTWVRVIINQIINNNLKKENEVFDDLPNIRRYPTKNDIEGISEILINNNEANNTQKLVEHTVKRWIPSQQKINLNGKVNILKTHNMLCEINLSEKKYAFTNTNNTTGVIHIVRDPRNIVTSLKNHFSDETFEETIEMLFEKFNWSGLTENEVPQLLSSWQNHYNSWKKFPNNNLLIRYEDILNNPKNEINRIANYIKKFIKLEISDKKINKIIFNTTFNNFKKQEAKGYFKENSINKKTGEKNIFFYLGPNNNWKSILNKKFSDEIEEKFKIEMQELGYI